MDSEPAPVILQAPQGLTAAQVTPFLQSSRVEVTACAAHLLALLDDPQGMGLLVDHWRADPSDPAAQRLLYQAITVTNNPASVPVLEEIYFQMTKSKWSTNMGDFYWTIRTMSGPEIIALRKKIRSEQTASKLRSVSHGL